MRKVLVINGHPDKESFNYSLSDAYVKGVQMVGSSNKSTLVRINIAELDFNPNLGLGYRQRIDLEPDLEDAINKIKEADHIVWLFPVWWYGCPAIMKGFIDRVFLPGITFQPIQGKAFPKKLLKGKSARLIITADTPKWYDYLVMKRPAINQFKKGTLGYCGVKPVSVTYIAPIKNSTPKFRENWLKKVIQLGIHLK